MKLNLLVVTDHSTHGPTNSLYELVVAMYGDPRCSNIWICSRGIPENQDFFRGIKTDIVQAAPVTDSFSFDESGSYLLEGSLPLPLDQIDAILVRMPQPLDKKFMLSLENIIDPSRIINRPSGTIETSSKEFLTTLPHLCPLPVMVYSADEAIRLSASYEIVLKPLYSYGGRGIVRLSQETLWMGMDQHPAQDAPSLLHQEMFPMLSMKYLPNVSFGDKRTVVVNKKILGSALRMPPENSWICNVAQGGHAVMSSPDSDELAIEHELTPLLYEKGIVMYGYDTLLNDNGRRVLSEINTLSIGGLGPMAEMSGKPMLQDTAKLLWDYLDIS